MKKEDISIFIASHKESMFPSDRIYIPLHVGAEGKKDLGYLKDNSKDNISDKNTNYCELTGLYWIWKNRNDEIVGLTHYRRYFFKKFNQHKLEDVLTKQDIKEILNEYDIIVPKKLKILNGSVRNIYQKKHYIKDYDECRKIIEEKYKDYIDAFDTVSNRKYLFPYNMFIMKKDIFNKYCEWLFDILFELEKRTDISNYDDYNKRIYGFLSERLFNVWLEKNKQLRKKEMYVYNIEDNILKVLCVNTIKNIVVRG